jgi:hypothetical protein
LFALRCNTAGHCNRNPALRSEITDIRISRSGTPMSCTREPGTRSSIPQTSIVALSAEGRLRGSIAGIDVRSD